MREKFINRAKSLGWKVYQDSLNQWTIEIVIKEREIILQEKDSNKWLLLSNKVPQAILKPKEVSRFLKGLKKKSTYFK